MLSAWKLGGDASLWTLQIVLIINLLIKFNKTRQIFVSVTRVLSILLTKTATYATLERVHTSESV